MTSFWISCEGEQLEQGDYLPGCWIPVVGADFDPAAKGTQSLALLDQFLRCRPWEDRKKIERRGTLTKPDRR